LLDPAAGNRDESASGPRAHCTSAAVLSFRRGAIDGVSPRLRRAARVIVQIACRKICLAATGILNNFGFAPRSG
jgi:hypothetical protein